ncbi:DUF262 domain-containing protein [Aestuariibaculum lutulentum]|uniref:DUF262 domain-containing HNH endonuclease family protein n=1 Tax=Aestuariibaculum lutulentum TaxID=2920935 RepID=A0ABS9RGW9_9FLAO|nr:DUF262 domain-containing protein [Aestuariibaculum lutulentum]MCH4552196.1 DUF262 domain-containing HNH endonuclease family protein [Aestuariibaculum lutulentum]
MENKFNTDIVSLASLDAYDFSIPTYQRPYVWGNEQIKKLLDDFLVSFRNTNNESYYVSTFLTKENGTHAELIDGQQRFTTLWIIAFVMHKLNSNSTIIHFLKKDDKLRLGFEIRKEVSDYLEHLLDANLDSKKYDENLIVSYPYLKNIANAIVFVKSYLEQLKFTNAELKKFGDFIYYNVKLIKNTTPENTDLNKLFSTINSAGIQLEQSDIVKANLLKCIDNKVLYSRIWETCENMSNFFERNARVSFLKTDWKAVKLENFIDFNENIFKYQNDEEHDENNELFSIDVLTTDEISEYQFPSKQVETEKDRKKSEEIYCRSIINFPQLLLHTYRIHLKQEGKDDFEGTFHSNRLIEIFKNLTNKNNSDEIKRFFKLLWKVRYLFDKYIVKWITDLDNKTETLELVNFNRNEESYYSRTKYEKSPSMMLQSVLYFTGDYLRQYWLTSYLGFLVDNHNNLKATDEFLLNKLEKIDNSFSLNTTINDKDISWSHINAVNVSEEFSFENYLKSGNHGTSFKHYWFQKLEYILWKQWQFEKDDKFNKFRITSKNSVEHIYPQNPENRIQHPELDKEHLDSFGNLVLLSVAQNSEYSNKSVNVKKSMFNEKSETYDSLKSYYIFKDLSLWNSTSIEKHKNEMITKIESFYKHA